MTGDNCHLSRIFSAFHNKIVRALLIQILLSEILLSVLFLTSISSVSVKISLRQLFLHIIHTLIQQQPVKRNLFPPTGCSFTYDSVFSVLPLALIFSVDPHTCHGSRL